MLKYGHSNPSRRLRKVKTVFNQVMAINLQEFAGVLQGHLDHKESHNCYVRVIIYNDVEYEVSCISLQDDTLGVSFETGTVQVSAGGNVTLWDEIFYPDWSYGFGRHYKSSDGNKLAITWGADED